jgi:hypothetical protein
VLGTYFGYNGQVGRSRYVPKTAFAAYISSSDQLVAVVVVFDPSFLPKLTARRCIFPQPLGGDPFPIDGQLGQSDCDCGT